MVLKYINIFVYYFRSPTPNSPPEPIAYKLCIICHPVFCASAHGFKKEVILVNLYVPILNDLARIYMIPIPPVAPIAPNDKKCEILVPAVIIITETTNIIITEALR